MDRLQELRQRFVVEPYVGALGAKLKEITHGRAVLSCRPHRLLTVAGGLVQGGATASLIDFAGVYAAMSVIPAGHTPASSMHVTFLRPVREGEELVIEATVVHTGRRRIVTEVRVVGEGKLKARASVEFFRPRS